MYLGKSLENNIERSIGDWTQPYLHMISRSGKKVHSLSLLSLLRVTYLSSYFQTKHNISKNKM